MKKLLLILILLISPSVLYAAPWAIYVDPGASGANDGGRDGADPNDPSQAANWTDAYTTLAAAENYVDGVDWVTNTDSPIIYCRSSTGADDTTETTFDGGTEAGYYNATYYPTIIQYDFPSDGVLDETKYILKISTSTNKSCLNIADNYIRIQGLQVHINITASNPICQAIYVNNSDNIYLDSCIIKGTSSGTGKNAGVYAYISDNIYLYNSIIYDFNSGTDADFEGVKQYGNAGDDMFIYNCTFEDCYNGISEDNAGSVTAKNCILANIWNNATEGDGVTTATNQTTATGGNWANDFANLAGEDYDLVSGSNAINNGTDNPGTGLYSDDIIGTARASTWDIGAYEYSGGGGGGQSSTLSTFGGSKGGGKCAGKNAGKQD